jgi:hypothetical protein
MYWKKALFLALSITLAFGVGEVGARQMLHPPYRVRDLSAGHKFTVVQGAGGHVSDPEIGWVLPPGTVQVRDRPVGRDGSPQFGVIYSMEQGRRLTACQRQHGPEIICTGCSFTFGEGLEDQDTWPWLLQKSLPDYSVTNVASMAYGTDQALLAAQREASGAAHAARVVILGFGDFQIERNRSPQGWMVVVYPFRKPLFLPKGSGLEYKGLVRFYTPGPLLEKSVFLSHLTNKIGNVVQHIPSHEEAREVTIRLITEFARKFEAAGATLVVAMLPYAGDHVGDPKADQAVVIQRLRAANVLVLVPRFPRKSNGSLDAQEFMVSVSDRHPNRSYNALLADELAEFLRTNVLGRLPSS